MNKAVCFFCEEQIHVDDSVFRFHGSFRRMIFQACLGSGVSLSDMGVSLVI